MNERDQIKVRLKKHFQAEMFAFVERKQGENVRNSDLLTAYAEAVLDAVTEELSRGKD